MTCEFKWLGEARSNMTGSECLSLCLVSPRGPLTHAEYYLCDTVICFPWVIWRKEKWQFLQEVVTTDTLCFDVQEAFFGKDLLDKSKQSRQQGVESGLLEEGQSQVERKYPTTSFLDPSSDPLLSASAASLPTRPAAGRMYTVQISKHTDIMLYWTVYMTRLPRMAKNRLAQKKNN